MAAISAWWRSQDPAWAPRFDLYPFPGCAPGAGALDLADVTLPAKGYRFVSWSGSCRGRLACTIKPGAVASVGATFSKR